MAFLRVNGLRSVEFGTPGPMRNRLNDLIINGSKRATAGLLKEDYIDEGDEIDFVGERLAILDNDNESTTWVEYWLDGELVHRSVHVALKKNVSSVAEAASFN